jgi:hypothetical protein
VTIEEAEQLIAAQADGLACIYCGLSGRQDGSLDHLRPAVRPDARSRSAPGQASIGRSVRALHVSRCEPPCPEALAAYQDGFTPSRGMADP